MKKRKNEYSSWLEEERAREERNFDEKYGNPYARLDGEDVYKVTSQRDADFKPNYLRRLALVGLTALIISLPIANHIEKSHREQPEAPKQTAQQVQGIHQEVNKIATIDVDGINLEIVSPEMRYLDGEFKYVAPEGYIYDGYYCYRLTCEGEAPEGYVKGENGKTLYQVDSETRYYAPEGYILVGDKAVSVVDATAHDNNGQTVYTVPNGYVLQDKIGYKTICATPIAEDLGYEIDYSDVVDPIVRTTYSAPSGYTLEGTKCVRKVKTISYLLVQKYEENGQVTYSVPNGYTLEYIGGKPAATRYETQTINATARTTYSAPEGYILIGNKCYKIVEPEKGMGK